MRGKKPSQMDDGFVPVGGYLWYCLEHGSFGWAIDEEECYETSSFHEQGWVPRASQDASNKIIHALLLSGEHPDHDSSLIYEAINEIRLQKEFFELPNEFWSVVNDKNEFDCNLVHLLINRLLLSPCSIVLVDVAFAFEVLIDRTEDVSELSKTEEIPILVAAQILIDRDEDEGELDYRGRELMEGLEDWLNRRED